MTSAFSRFMRFRAVFALCLIQMQVERDVERNAYRGGDGGGEADFGQAGVRLNAHAIGNVKRFPQKNRTPSQAENGFGF